MFAISTSTELQTLPTEPLPQDCQPLPEQAQLPEEVASYPFGSQAKKLIGDQVHWLVTEVKQQQACSTAQEPDKEDALDFEQTLKALCDSSDCASDHNSAIYSPTDPEDEPASATQGTTGLRYDQAAAELPHRPGWRIPRRQGVQRRCSRSVFSDCSTDSDQHRQQQRSRDFTSSDQLYRDRSRRRIKERRAETELWNRCEGCQDLGHTIDFCPRKWCDHCKDYGDHELIDRYNRYQCPYYWKKRVTDIHEADLRKLKPVYGRSQVMGKGNQEYKGKGAKGKQAGKGKGSWKGAYAAGRQWLWDNLKEKGPQVVIIEIEIEIEIVKIDAAMAMSIEIDLVMMFVMFSLVAEARIVKDDAVLHLHADARAAATKVLPATMRRPDNQNALRKRRAKRRRSQRELAATMMRRTLMSLNHRHQLIAKSIRSQRFEMAMRAISATPTRSSMPTTSLCVNLPKAR